jgi:hypothetical protein
VDEENTIKFGFLCCFIHDSCTFWKSSVLFYDGFVWLPSHYAQKRRCAWQRPFSAFNGWG